MPGPPGGSIEIDREARGGEGDRAFLERVFHKLMLNFTWWVNRKDAEGRNIFQGGFLGLDNIGIFDRSAPLPTGGHINQSDGTAWMAMYTLNLMRIALELAAADHVYEDIATKFFEHFLLIAEAMTNIGGDADRPMGRGRRVLLRRAAAARRRRGAAAGALDRRADPALRRRGARRRGCFAGCPSSRGGCTGFSSTGRNWRGWCRAGSTRATRSGICCRCCAATG